MPKPNITKYLDNKTDEQKVSLICGLLGIITATDDWTNNPNLLFQVKKAALSGCAHPDLKEDVIAACDLLEQMFSDFVGEIVNRAQNN